MLEGIGEMERAARGKAAESERSDGRAIVRGNGPPAKDRDPPVPARDRGCGMDLGL